MTVDAGEIKGRSEGAKGELELRGGGDLEGGGIERRRDGAGVGGSLVIAAGGGGSGDGSSGGDLHLEEAEARVDLGVAEAGGSEQKENVEPVSFGADVRVEAQEEEVMPGRGTVIAMADGGDEDNTKEPETMASEFSGLAKPESDSRMEERKDLGAENEAACEFSVEIRAQGQEPAPATEDVDEKGDVDGRNHNDSANNTGEMESAAESEISDEIRPQELKHAPLIKEIQNSQTGSGDLVNAAESEVSVEITLRGQEPAPAREEVDEREDVEGSQNPTTGTGETESAGDSEFSAEIRPQGQESARMMEVADDRGAAESGASAEIRPQDLESACLIEEADDKGAAESGTSAEIRPQELESACVLEEADEELAVNSDVSAEIRPLKLESACMMEEEIDQGVSKSEISVEIRPLELEPAYVKEEAEEKEAAESEFSAEIRPPELESAGVMEVAVYQGAAESEFSAEIRPRELDSVCLMEEADHKGAAETELCNEISPLEKEPAPQVDEKGDLAEGNQNSVKVTVEIDNVSESGSSVETRPQEQVSELLTERVDDVGDVEEEIQKSINGAEKINSVADSELCVEPQKQKPAAVAVTKEGYVEGNAAESKSSIEIIKEEEPQNVMDQTKIDAELKPVVGQELNQETSIGIEKSKDFVESRLAAPEVESVKESEIVVEGTNLDGSQNIKVEGLVENENQAKDTTALSTEVRSLPVLVNDVHLELQNAELRSYKYSNTETEDCVVDVEAVKDVSVDKMKQESESGNESAEGCECVVSSVEGARSTNKDDDDELGHEQTQAAEMTQPLAEKATVKHRSIYMIRSPRFSNTELHQQIMEAQSELEKKTQERDELSRAVREQEAIVKKFGLDHKAEHAKLHIARAIFKAKHDELENMQECANILHVEYSIAVIDEKVRNIVHKQQHETMSLKQEKEYVQEINQLKREREHLSSIRASKEKLDEALNHRLDINEKLKKLKKEFDSLEASVALAENNKRSALGKYMAECEHSSSLRERRDAAHQEREKAYQNLKKLKQLYDEKAKPFKMYRVDKSAANRYMSDGDNRSLEAHCSQQVERYMDMWTNNAEFRKNYVKCNTNSTLRRLGTVDGRSLGLGEEAPILPPCVEISTNTIASSSSRTETPTPNLVTEARLENMLNGNQSAKRKSDTKAAPVEHNVPPISNGEASKEVAKLAPTEHTVPPISNGESSKEEEKENKLKEEEELARKAEELARKEEELRKEKTAREEQLRREKAAAELKEKLRLEQKAKAREAEERKRRKAEKDQARAAYKAQKEAEEKEKMKAKKKSKNSGKVETADAGTENLNSPVSDANQLETSQQPEVTSASTSKKRSAKSASSMRRYNKTQTPVPLPLRNRGKRKMTMWMWALAAVLLVLAVFLAGNYISLSTAGLPNFGF